MNVLTVAGLVVAAIIVVAIIVAAHRSGRGSADASSPEPPLGGTAFGGVPGYMPGMSPRVEQQREVIAPTRVEPPHPTDGPATVDLDGNVARLRSPE